MQGALQFEIIVSDETTDLYTDHTETGTGHVAVTIRTLGDGALTLGRLVHREDSVVLNADRCTPSSLVCTVFSVGM